MKEFIKGIRSVLAILFSCVLVCFNLLSCKEVNNGGTTIYYGFVTTMEENHGLFVEIPNHGICSLPAYESGKVQDVTLTEGDFIKMEFNEESVRFIEIYPAKIDTPVSKITVIDNTTYIERDGAQYLLTVEYDENIKFELERTGKTVDDEVAVWQSFPVNGGEDALEERYSSAKIVKIEDGSITFRLNLPENVNFFLEKVERGFIFLKGDDIEIEAPEDPEKTIISLPSEIEKQFDLTDEKIWYEHDPKAEFATDSILIIFMKSTTYPELSIDVFNFENAESIEYLMARPHQSQENNENYRQIAKISLKEKSREKVVEAINYFERISIIRCAHPNYIIYIEEC